MKEIDHPEPETGNDALTASYVLPIATQTSPVHALTGYLHRLSRAIAEVIVVDGSPEEIFEAHARAWSGYIRHIRPGMQTMNGKVGA